VIFEEQVKIAFERNTIRTTLKMGKSEHYGMTIMKWKSFRKACGLCREGINLAVLVSIVLWEGF